MSNKFTQVVVWPHTVLGDNTEEDFKNYMTKTFKSEVKLIGEHRITKDRTDLLFYINADDIPKFAVARLTWGMRWLEDVMANDGTYQPPEGIAPTWNKDAINEAQTKHLNS